MPVSSRPRKPRRWRWCSTTKASCRRTKSTSRGAANAIAELRSVRGPSSAALGADHGVLEFIRHAGEVAGFTWRAMAPAASLIFSRPRSLVFRSTSSRSLDRDADRISAVAAGILDCELCYAGPDGRPDFNALIREMRSPRPDPFHLVLYAFDVMHINGRDLRSKPLYERRWHPVELGKRSSAIPCFVRDRPVRERRLCDGVVQAVSPRGRGVQAAELGLRERRVSSLGQVQVPRMARGEQGPGGPFHRALGAGAGRHRTRLVTDARGSASSAPTRSSAHHGTEGLEPEGMREAAQELIAAVVVHDGLADDGAETRHALAQPCRHATAMEWEISAAGTSCH
jgi:hypothetical protein